ncbi:MAG TPA: hypothetical protein PKH94_02645 [Bacteroidales bacterium]|nr:hypothetical protein [Bacteroidales bacterium]HNS46116.1 hypothetical protein [Bacteroidales bacterium]
MYAQAPEFGNAPEGSLAYPATGTLGQFTTCKTVLSADWIEHNKPGGLFGSSPDMETDGNARLCPGFAPYNAYEGQGDGDAGLIIPAPFTIVGQNLIQRIS